MSSLTKCSSQRIVPPLSVILFQCWVDLKSNARSRAAKFRAMSLDGPMPTGSMFTQWDERVLQLLNDISANGNVSRQH